MMGKHGRCKAVGCGRQQKEENNNTERNGVWK